MAVLFNKFKEVKKRDGRIVPFDQNRITEAIRKAMVAAGEGNIERDPQRVSDVVVEELNKRYPKDHIPHIEEIQDIVEESLILMDFPKTAKAYILYRQKRTEIRQKINLVPERVKELVRESKKYFRNPLSEFIYYRSYSRWIEEEGRRETWIETVDRYINFMKENLENRLSEDEYQEIREAILTQNVMPSMRLLWSAGKAARATNVAAYNCSFISPQRIEDLAEIMYLLMCGTGVGFSVENQNIQQFPIVKRQTGKVLPAHIIEDSKEGWADALTLGLKSWYNGYDITFDYSKVRPAGSRLRTMGGRSSGPGPLKALLDFSRAKILSRQGRRLSSLDLHDIICKIGEIVVAGGVRRSALISLSDLDDDQMRSAKSGYFYITEPQRQMANNSAVYNEKPDAVKFMEEWLALAKSGTGERGIFNRGSLKYQLPERRWKTFEKYWQTCGTNPCVTADTWIMTQEGPRQVQDLIGVPFVAVVNGKHHLSPTGFFSTGKKETFLIRTQRGFSFKATADHPVLTVKYRSRKVRINEWKLVKDLLPGDEIVLHNHNNVTWQGIGNAYEGWLLGSLVGDGNIEKNGKANLDFWGPTRDFMLNQAVVFIRNSVLARSDLTGYIAKTGYARVGSLGLGKLAFTYGISYGSKCITPDIEKSSSDFYQGFLRGWFDADGSVQGDQNKGVSVRLSSNSLENLEAAQRMLARLGIISTIYENRKQAGWMMLPDGRGGEKEYFCKAYHELIITGSNILTFYRRIGFSDPQKRDKLEKLLCLYKRKLNREKFSTKVIAIEPAGIEEVYDCFVSDVHAFDGNGVFLHNCGEIILRSKQFCNLTEVVCRPEDTEESLLKKVRIATILGTYQSMLTDFPYLSKEWKENCEEERLLGVSLTGQWDCPQVRNPETLRKLKEHAIEINKIYAKRFGINPSMAITCIKPSGCRPWYALTSTTDGLLTLEELFEHHNENRKWDEFGGSAKVIQNPHPARILKTYQNGFDRLLRITMNYGLVVESTLNHPWFVSYHYNRSRGRNNKKVPVNKWVEARNLKIGDVLELKLGVYSKTDSFRLEKLNSLAIKMRGDVKDIYQPDYMNQDLAWFLGYLWGDGALSPGKFRIRFVDQYKENLEKAARVLKEQFGIDSTLRKASEHRKAYTLEIGSKMLWHWLIKNNVFKYYADRIDLIPRCVRASSRDDIIAFIAGLLDSDGWVGTQSNKNGYTLTITTSDPFFAQHLQDVAWAVGLGLGRSLNSKGNNLQKEKQMYLLTLGRYVDPDAFNVLAKNSNKIQTAIKRNDFKRWLWQNKKNNTLIAGKIIKIEEVGVVPTYDIEVENHWYYAGCVKSHNTVSQLVDSSSGMHPRHSQYYIRRVRISATDPLFHMLRDQKFPYHPEVGQLESNATTFVLDFPVKAPDGAITRHDLSALDQLNHWKMVKLNYTEHNPSVTIYIRNNEWLLVADWLYQNWDILGGLSFLPMEEHVYQLAPYEEITKEEYEDLVKKLPDVDFSAIVAYEKEDSTSGAKELACVGNVCEIDIAESTK